MTDRDSPGIRALITLLRETLIRADRQAAYLLNPSDPGLVESLKPLSAQTASQAPGPGRKSIAAHANHVLYGIELANRALSGEEGVYEKADWSQAWQLESVTESQWRDLVSRLEQQTKLLLEQVARPRQWDELTLTGAFSIAAHTAYHLGAIRQMLLELGRV
jgi:uncharacterized damage-inducible protein DinB